MKRIKLGGKYQHRHTPTLTYAQTTNKWRGTVNRSVQLRFTAVTWGFACAHNINHSLYLARELCGMCEMTKLSSSYMLYTISCHISNWQQNRQILNILWIHTWEFASRNTQFFLQFHCLMWGKKWRKLFSQQAFKQYPAASKHTPTILHTTHFWSHPVYPLSHINWLSQISVTSRCFAQTLLRYLHFEFPLICSILRVCIVLKPYVSAAHKKRKQAVAPKEASLYRMHAELSFVCKTTLSNRLNASSHRLPPTKSASFIV